LTTHYGVKNELLSLIFEMYGINGDALAQQYAGSEAFHKATLIDSGNGDWKAKKDSILVVSIKRYLNNTLLDYEKQKVIWLFLGEFIPSVSEKKHLWELDFKDAEKNIENEKINKLGARNSLTWWKGCYCLNVSDQAALRYNRFKYEKMTSIGFSELLRPVKKLNPIDMSNNENGYNQNEDNDDDEILRRGNTRPRNMKPKLLNPDAYFENSLTRFEEEYRQLENTIFKCDAQPNSK